MTTSCSSSTPAGSSYLRNSRRAIPAPLGHRSSRSTPHELALPARNSRSDRAQLSSCGAADDKARGSLRVSTPRSSTSAAPITNLTMPVGEQLEARRSAPRRPTRLRGWCVSRAGRAAGRGCERFETDRRRFGAVASYRDAPWALETLSKPATPTKCWTSCRRSSESSAPAQNRAADDHQARRTVEEKSLVLLDEPEAHLHLRVKCWCVSSSSHFVTGLKGSAATQAG